jgi:hypothetical protein
MSLTSRLVAYAIVVAAVLAALWGYGRRERVAGRAEVRAEWRESERLLIQAEAGRRASDLDAAYALAAEYEAQRHDLEMRHVEISNSLRRALQRPASCHAGQTLGSLVLPADVLDGLRAAAGPAHPASGPAAPQPGR